MGPTKNWCPEINVLSLSKGVYRNYRHNPTVLLFRWILAYHPTRFKYKMKRVFFLSFSTISPVFRTGVKALAIENELPIQGWNGISYPIGKNAPAHCDVVFWQWLYEEEMKLATGATTIFNDRTFSRNGNCRFASHRGGHSESKYVVIWKRFWTIRVRDYLSDPGIVVQDNRNTILPMPIYAHGKDDVLIGGGLDGMKHTPNTLNMLIVRGHLRQEGRTNAVTNCRIICSSTN